MRAANHEAGLSVVAKLVGGWQKTLATNTLPCTFLRRVLRFRLMVYVPCMIWKANTDLD